MNRILLPILALVAGNACFIERPFYLMPIRDLNRPPTARLNGPFTVVAGVPLTVDASNSFDLDDDPLTYEWSFGDTERGSGVVAEHIYGQEGSYELTLTVTDTHGAADRAKSTVTVLPPPP